MRMNHGTSTFEVRHVVDVREGFSAVELHLTAPEERLVARIVFWDAEGQFYFEGRESEIPLGILEQLIAAAKTEVKT